MKFPFETITIGYFRRVITILFYCLFCTACSPNLAERAKMADKVAEPAHFVKSTVKGGEFLITTYQRITEQSQPYVFYIESDGHAFMSYGVSDNPTPFNPLLLKLATVDKRPNIVYIARPCQYTPMELNPICMKSPIYWTHKRLSEEVVNSINQVIETINNGKRFSLVGYSGGGGIAVLIAARNKNVKDILTLAANLDTVGFSNYHNKTGASENMWLTKSLNPLDYATQIRNIPQLHVAAGKDKAVPEIVINNYVKASNSSCVHQQTIPDITHYKGWEEVWSSILSTPITCH